MKNSKKIGTLLFILGISLIAVLWYANGLRKENAALNKTLIEMRHTIENSHHLIIDPTDNSKITENISLDDISMTYIENKVRFVFSDEALQALALPLEKAPNLRSIEPLTAVTVLDLVYSNDEEWYYVKIPVLDSPVNVKGWIRVDQVIELDKTNINEIKAPVYVKKGASINVLWNEGNIDESAESEILEHDVYGRIIKEDSGHCYLSTPGGFEFWIKKDELSFPQAEPIQ
ncbi:hypothetical protein [Fusibacter ferrireducens]|uniref:SH3 domain-containing protein n=1 Tax=Fusibacter ferrireducens TaxID=2785058 RepID=A0ABR9ZV69_9FIRM|nr:hypothetical protein [Fusibacter ferrireducens]MBF4694068.1 hypothetical protein [Fusibacter ferrireducens]